MYSAIIPSEKRINPLKSEMKITVVVQPGIEKPNKDSSPVIFMMMVKIINRSEFKDPVQLWSMFCLLKEDITKTTKLRDINEIVTTMREGLYNTENNYPKVDSLERKGIQLVLQQYSKQGSSGKKPTPQRGENFN